MPAVFAALKPVLAKRARSLAVAADTEAAYSLVSKRPSPFPRHKDRPLPFGWVRVGKAHVSFHPHAGPHPSGAWQEPVAGAEEAHAGQVLLNCKTAPEPGALAELARLAAAGLQDWSQKNWV
jgi:hypothetical protein